MPPTPTDLINRAGPRSVALETTLLVHGVPREAARPLQDELARLIIDEGASPALVGVVSGNPIVGMSAEELATLLDAPAAVPKANTGNLGVLMHRGAHAATTVSATMELAAAAGVRVFATGGLGGVHQGYGTHWDISADLPAMARFPIAVVASGVKNLLDVVATREALESLGVPVVGFGTDRFPAFYLRESAAEVDARFDDVAELAGFAAAELARTGRGVLVCNPIPTDHAIDPERWTVWLAEARQSVEHAGVTGRGVTPAILADLHRRSGGATLKANLALVRSNARLAARLAAAMPPP